MASLLSLAVLAGVPGLAGAEGASAAAVPAATVTVTPPAAPALSAVAGPTRGGTAVDLSGTGVGTTTKVLFGTTAVTSITKVSTTRVRVLTPAHAAGIVNVRVTTPSGTSPLSSRSTFAFDAVPAVSSLSVRSATTTGGSVLTVTGSNLSRTSAVLFGTTGGTGLVRVSATQVRVTVPAHAAGAVDVRVVTPGGTSPVTSVARFSYVAPPVVLPPTVTRLSVSAGPTRGGTVLTLTGTRFSGATKVTFGGVLGTQLAVLSSTQMRITTPARPAGSVYVLVTTPSGRSAGSGANTFTYDGVPTLTRVSPASGGTGGGATVTLTGTGLERASAVRFGTTLAPSVTRVSATTLRVTTPAHAVGTTDVRVTTPGGTTAVTVPDRYTYYDPPAVTRLSVPAGPVGGGTLVYLTGARFTGSTRLTFGDTAAQFTILSPTSIRAVAPAHAAGAVSVRLSSPNGTSAASSATTYSYEPVPTVTSLSPLTGPPAGGTVVTLTGTGFGRASSVAFGTTTTTTIVRVSSTTLRVTAPAHASGPVDVRVTSPGGVSPVSTTARYVYGAPPVVSGLSVSAGPLAGGTVVTLSGSHLAEVREVRFGTTVATGLVRVSDTSLRVTAPAHAEGVVPVRATNVNGTSPDSTRTAFTYVGVPGISALSAPAGPLTGGVPVTITGTRLGLASAVDFGGLRGTGLVRLSATSLRVTAPGHVAGTVDVRVTTPGGTSPVVAAGRFTYQPVPTVGSVAPALAPTKGGTVVTLTGTGYDRVSAVTFGGVPATAVSRVSATQLRVTLPAHAEADVDVRVTTPGGTSPVVPAGRFAFQDVPVISSVSPASGALAGGNVVTLRGTSFTVVTGVWINGVPATSVTRVSATQLTAVVPARMATGPVPVRVTTRAGTVTRASAYTYVAGSTLAPGQVLLSGTALRSPNGVYQASMQTDGNLVISSGGVRRWATGTTGAGNRLFVRSDGQLAIMRADSTLAWTSGTNGWTGSVATLTNDGLLQLRQGATPVWDHRGIRYDRLLSNQLLRSGESVVSTGKAWSLTMRTDGNLVLSSSQGIRRWASFTSGAGSSAAMQTDGNLVVRDARGVVQWSTKTTGSGSFLRVLDTGNAAVYRSSTVTWAVTGGPAPQGWACYSRATQDCISRFGYYGQRAWSYPVDAWGNNCTNFSAYRLSVNGVPNPGNLGNAQSWDDNARAKGFAVDQSPRVGDIAQWNSNHVAYVDWVSSDGNTVAISESGYGGTVLGKTYTSMSGRRILTRGSYSWPSNFIHFR
ncbi:MAG TPA: IPT/TIG domain-containing protein [Terrabacter sp.]|nr:IPT/TIG domain-containing protein [Terrabacter sp.]